MTEIQQFIFYASPFVFIGAGFAMGWTLNNIIKDKKEKKKND